MKDIDEWLTTHGLGRFLEAFAEHEVGLDILPDLSEDDLREIGLPLGARRRFQAAVREGLAAPQIPGATTTTGGGEPPEPDRRQLTVLFCDLAESTRLSTRLDPEDLRRVLRTFQDTCAAGVERYGGYLAKFMGDGALAYFGYPDAHENDAERAIRAALDIIDAVAARRDATGLPPLRLGIATGFVVVGDIIGREASQEATVTGETPNLAARLQGLASPGSIVVDETTLRLAGGYFESTEAGLHRLKGFEEPRRVFEVTGLRPAPSRFAAARIGRLSDLVGRDEEAEALHRRWRDAREERGHLVLVGGEPGIGKSRLVHALRERIGDEDHVAIQCQCSAFHTDSALHPVLERIRLAARLESGEPPGDRLEKLAAFLGRGGVVAEHAAPLLARMLSAEMGEGTPDPAPPSQHQRQVLIDLLAGHLAGMAARNPVLFVLEDAHWLDPTSAEFLDELVGRLHGLRLLVVVTYRTGFDPPWAGEARVTTLNLGRLGPSRTRSLIRQVCGERELPRQVVEQIIGRTDGIPLFVEEFTRAALESGSHGEPIEIPTTLKDALEARLSRLALGHEAAQVAAVIGRSFDYRLLEASYGPDAGLLPRALDELVGAGLLFVRGVPPKATCTFKHALVQDTAYESLLRERRRALHRRIARRLAERFPEVAAEQPEVIAHHLTRGGRAFEAIPHWQRAGELAARRSAITEAIHHFTRAIELVQSQPEDEASRRLEIHLQLELAPLHMAASGFTAPEAARAYERAYEQARGIADRESTFTALWGRWMMSFLDPVQRQDKLVRQLLTLAGEHGDPGQQLQAHHASWSTLFFLGDFEGLDAHCRAGFDLYDREAHRNHKFLFGGHDPGACALNFLSVARCITGRLRDGLATSEEALRLAHELGHPISSTVTSNLAALVRMLRREPEAALEHVERAVSLAREQGVLLDIFRDVFKGWILGEKGDPEQAIALMLRSFEAPAVLGQEPMRPLYLGVIADFCRQAGRPDEGLAHLERARGMTEPQGRHWCLGELDRVQALLLAELGHDDDRVEACFRRAIERSRGQGAALWQLRAANSCARWLAARKRVAEAVALLAEARAALPEDEATADLAEADQLAGTLGRRSAEAG